MNDKRCIQIEMFQVNDGEIFSFLWYDNYSINFKAWQTVFEIIISFQFFELFQINSQSINS